MDLGPTSEPFASPVIELVQSTRAGDTRGGGEFTFACCLNVMECILRCFSILQGGGTGIKKVRDMEAPPVGTMQRTRIAVAEHWKGSSFCGPSTCSGKAVCFTSDSIIIVHFLLTIHALCVPISFDSILSY